MTKDDRRREFQKEQWRKRVDAKMAAQKEIDHQFRAAKRSLRQKRKAEMSARERILRMAISGVLVIAVAAGIGLLVVDNKAPNTGTVPRNIVGKRLDRAEVELDNLNITYTEIDVNHTYFGINVPANWTVCWTAPDAGQALEGRQMRLFAATYGCPQRR